MKKYLMSRTMFALALLMQSQPTSSQVSRQENLVLVELEKRRAITNHFTAMFRVAINNDVESYKISKKDVDPPTPNRAYSIRWNTNGTLWRSDFSEIFPSEDKKRFPVYSGAYDGELYSYNQREQLGIVTGADKGLKSDSFLLLSFSYPDYGMIFGDVVLENIRDLAEEGVIVSKSGQERVGKFSCDVYSVSTDNALKSYQFKLWLDREHGRLPIKSVIKAYDKRSSSGSISSYIVDDVKLVYGDIYVASKARRDYFLMQKSIIKWSNTSTLFLDNVRVDNTKNNDLFSIVFPPGTRVANTLENPGKLEVVGGEYEDVLNLARQDAPKREYRDF